MKQQNTSALLLMSLSKGTAANGLTAPARVAAQKLAPVVKLPGSIMVKVLHCWSSLASAVIMGGALLVVAMCLHAGEWVV